MHLERPQAAASERGNSKSGDLGSWVQIFIQGSYFLEDELRDIPVRLWKDIRL